MGRGPAAATVHGNGAAPVGMKVGVAEGAMESEGIEGRSEGGAG